MSRALLGKWAEIEVASLDVGDQILVEETATGLSSVVVIDEDGARQIVRLKEPLMLPPVTTSV